MKKEYNYFATILSNSVNGNIEIAEENLELEEKTIIKNIVDSKITVDKIRKKVEFSVFLKKCPNVIKSEMFDFSELIQQENIDEAKADLNNFLDKQLLIWVKSTINFKLLEKDNRFFI